MNAVWLRPMTEADKDIIFRWANDPVTRENSLNQAEITKEEHERWFASKLHQLRCHYYMLVDAETTLGFLRLDPMEDAEGEYLVSINLSPSARGQGYGYQALALLNAQVAGEVPDARILHAEIKAQNMPSRRSFEKAGYHSLYVTGGEQPIAIYERSIDHSRVVYFRCDANQKVGSGHLMRCLTIADACNMKDLTPVFIMASDEMAEQVRKRGYVVSVLGTPYDEMHLELPILYTVMPEESILVLDSYAISDTYIKGLRAKGYFIYLLHDGGRVRKDVDCIINYNLSAHREDYPVSEMRCLIGASYAPVRDAFCDFPFGVTEDIREILITTGASDPYHISLFLAQALLAAYPQMKLQIVCGQFYTDTELLNCVSEKYAGRVEVLRGVTDLSPHMRRADVAIATAGSTVYELCAIGIPTILLSFVDNQLPIGQAYEEQFPGLYLGDFRTELFDAAQKAVSCIKELTPADKRRELSMQMQLLVDGKGAERIAEAILDIANS